MPTFITELGREVERPMPERMRIGGPLAAIARDHARNREALGFAPREVVTEFLLLRRVLWRVGAPPPRPPPQPPPVQKERPPHHTKHPPAVRRGGGPLHPPPPQPPRERRPGPP